MDVARPTVIFFNRKKVTTANLAAKGPVKHPIIPTVFVLAESPTLFRDVDDPVPQKF